MACSRQIRPTSSPLPRLLGERGRRGRRRSRARSSGLPRALRSAEPRWLLGSRKTLGVARALRWVPTADRLEIDSLSGAGREALGLVVERVPGPDRRRPSSSPRARLAPRRESSTACGGWPLSSPPSVRATASAGRSPGRGLRALRAVRAGPRDPGGGSRLRHHRARVAAGRGARRRVAAIDATILFAAPAALEGVLSSRRRASRRGRTALRALRLVLSAGAPVPQACSKPSGPGTRARAAHPVRDDRGAVADGYRPAGDRRRGPGRGSVRGPAAGRARRADRAAPGGAGEMGEIVVARPGSRSGTTASGRRTTGHGLVR